MDLRLLNHAIIFKGTIDIANTEFSKEEQGHKYYKNMLKTVLSSRVQLNSLISYYPNITKGSIKKIKLPFSIVSGMVHDVYSIELVSSSLYQQISCLKKNNNQRFCRWTCSHYGVFSSAVSIQWCLFHVSRAWMDQIRKKVNLGSSS